jgi:hypothetical protein
VGRETRGSLVSGFRGRDGEGMTESLRERDGVAVVAIVDVLRGW